VPISVVVPPRIDAKASGIKTLPGGMPSRAASDMATGISSASAPTLFMKPESSAASPVSAAMDSVGPLAAGSTMRANTSTAPERCKPWLSTSTHATVMTAGWPNPVKATFGATSPRTTQASNAPTATMSWRQRPHRNMTTMPASMARISVWSLFIDRPIAGQAALFDRSASRRSRACTEPDTMIGDKLGCPSLLRGKYSCCPTC